MKQRNLTIILILLDILFCIAIFGFCKNITFGLVLLSYFLLSLFLTMICCNDRSKI
jgi:uncharacterized membrane protein YkvI